jgi:signal transduction histidine kinase
MPLKIRVVSLVVVILAIVVVAISAVAYRELRESLVGNSDMALRSLAQVTRADLGEPTSTKARANLESVLGDGSRRGDFLFRIWNRATGEVLLASSAGRDVVDRWAARLDPAREPQVGQESCLDLRDGDRAYRAIWFRHPAGNGVTDVLIATSNRYAYHEMEEFLRMLLILGTSTLLAATVLTALFVLWAMRPIRQTADRLSGVTHRNLGEEHLAGIQAPSELVPFLDAVRGMLSRLDAAVQAQKRFIADASHELRTPLALAKSTLQAARMKQRSVIEYEQAMDELMDDVNRLERLTSQLLELTRLDETRGPEGMEDVPLDPLLRALAQQYDDRAAESGGKVVCEGLDTKIRVRGSAEELKSLFGNLLDNALKYGPRGGTVRVRLEAENADACRVVVHDEGGQIPPDKFEKLFDRFYRTDRSRSRATGGSGLGLSIAREIARKHGGDIWITSTPQDGTNLFVRLPRRS